MQNEKVKTARGREHSRRNLGCTSGCRLNSLSPSPGLHALRASLALGFFPRSSLGGLRLLDASDGKIDDAIDIADDQIGRVAWLESGRDHPFYAVGGTWRAIARLHMAKTNYPLNVLHGYQADAKAMIEFCQDLQKVELDSMPAISEIAKERRPLIAYGALVLEHLLRMSGAARLQVSTSGVREGMLHSLLPPELQAEDPLIVGARALSDLHARDPAHSDDLIAWTDEFAQSAFTD